MDGSLEAVTRGMTGERKEVFERVWRRVMHSGASEGTPLAESASLAEDDSLSAEGAPLAEDPRPENTPAAGARSGEAGSLALPAAPTDLPRGDFPCPRVSTANTW